MAVVAAEHLYYQHQRQEAVAAALVAVKVAHQVKEAVREVE